MNDEFYVGWEARPAPGIRRTIRRTVVALILLAVLLSAALAVSQRLIGHSAFEWGRSKTFSGILRTQPYPHLLVPRPGNVDGFAPFSTYHLVAPWKFGLDRETLAPLDGRFVTLRGTLIYRGHQTMVETLPESIRPSDEPSTTPLPRPIPLGRQTLMGEIVDSKCYFGVMNPGQLTPHRACAIRCISGGCPPVFLVRQSDGQATCLLLVSAEGKPVNEQVLDMVAEPLEVTGTVERHGEWLILRADPATYRRARRSLLRILPSQQLRFP
jgi:hypothetical protein